MISVKRDACDSLSLSRARALSLALSVLVGVVGAACSKPSSFEAASSASASGATATPIAIASSSSPATPTSAAPASGIAFIENDYARALAEAKRTHRPLFMDTWAPWCHTCMSMKSYVFPDAQLARLAQEYVWLAIDSEDASNADVLARFPASSLPTLWVIDPATERAALKWIGSATVAELEGLLDDAALAVRKGDAGGEAAAAFVRGNQATGAGKPEDAVREYKKALAVAPADWKRRPQAVEALSARLDELKLYAEGTLLAAAEIPKLPPGTSLANVVQNGLSAAYSLPREAPARAKLPFLVQEAKRIAGDMALPMLADDRSGIYEHVVAVLHDTDPPGAKKLAREWANFLEGEAKKATTPTARAVFDPHRLNAYIELGEVERAVPMLAQSERDLPSDYNPPARLARAYFELHRLDEARGAMSRALALAYGPRKMQILLLDADIENARGDKAAARLALDEAHTLAAAKGLPPRYARMREEIDRRLAAQH